MILKKSLRGLTSIAFLGHALLMNYFTIYAYKDFLMQGSVVTKIF